MHISNKIELVLLHVCFLCIKDIILISERIQQFSPQRSFLLMYRFSFLEKKTYFCAA